MTDNAETSLQAAVGVICGCLSDLSFHDQIRALEVARVTLGLPVAWTVYQEPSALPTVQVKMDGERPVVVGTSPPVERPRRGVVVLPVSQPDAQGTPRQPLAGRPRGYVRSLR